MVVCGLLHKHLVGVGSIPLLAQITGSTLVQQKLIDLCCRMKQVSSIPAFPRSPVVDAEPQKGQQYPKSSCPGPAHPEQHALTNCTKSLAERLWRGNHSLVLPASANLVTTCWNVFLRSHSSHVSKIRGPIIRVSRIRITLFVVWKGPLFFRTPTSI